jgi:hypothetical protein
MKEEIVGKLEMIREQLKALAEIMQRIEERQKEMDKELTALRGRAERALD